MQRWNYQYKEQNEYEEYCRNDLFNYILSLSHSLSLSLSPHRWSSDPFACCRKRRSLNWRIHATLIIVLYFCCFFLLIYEHLVNTSIMAKIFRDMLCLLILNGEKWWMWKISLKYQFFPFIWSPLRSFSIIKINNK